MVEIKNGSIDDFFASAKESAKEIDTGVKVTPKHTIWMDTEDLLNILKPTRTKVISYLKDKTKVYYSVMLKELKKSPSSLNRDLELLSKYQLIDISKEINSGHGIKKVIRPLYSNQELEFRAKI
jgi:DNA-binding transcriptional ArsR family regulator